MMSAELKARVARHRAMRRALSRGLTLVEMIVVITLIGSLMGVVGFAVFKQQAKAQLKLAETGATQFRTAAKSYQTTHPDAECVSPAQLKTEKEIESNANLNDPWGKPFKIVCDTDEITVISSGPDKKEGTEDDIRVPAAAAATK